MLKKLFDEILYHGSKNFTCILSDEIIKDASILSGVAISDNEIVSGAGGLKKYLSRSGKCFNRSDFRYGRYFAAIIKKGEGEIFTDPLGQEFVFYYKCGDKWAVANSFLYLAAKVWEKGWGLSFNYNAFSSLLVDSGHQLLSNNTPFLEIKILPLNHYMRITASSGIELVLDDNEVAEFECRFPRWSSEYKEKLVGWSDRWSSVFRTLEFHGKNIEADLTGGYDSRAVFSLLVSSGIPLEDKRIVSSKSKNSSRDYQAAKKISDFFNLELNKPSLAEKITYSPGESVVNWMLGNLGVYRPVFIISQRSCETFKLTGGVGGVLRKQYTASKNHKSLKLKFVDNVDAEGGVVAARTEFEKSFSEISSRIQPRGELDAHYLYYRNRFHFGRNTYRDLEYNTLSPLCDVDLLSLERGPKGQPQILLDIMAVNCPKLLQFDFDVEAKNVSPEDREVALSGVEGSEVQARMLDFYHGEGEGLHFKGHRCEESFFGSSSAKSAYRELFFLCCSSDSVIEFFGSKWIRNAVEEVLSAGYLPANSKYSSPVISYSVISSLCGESHS